MPCTTPKAKSESGVRPGRQRQTLSLTDLTGTRQKHYKLRERVWLHLVGDGIRALTLAGRWVDAVNHPQAHRGVGLHLMEGRRPRSWPTA